ncbi:hypothetical protein CEXT_194861 [Caerostris extrusa]|uniref:Uncharacterized protein n=1 Tax=Caerostris extrusa TaxID=172846 RepID=A0AAV4W1F8_CAEEX|nr:hypothetical protein CEXT_194861 [Caerostris extrusa]
MNGVLSVSISGPQLLPFPSLEMPTRVSLDVLVRTTVPEVFHLLKILPWRKMEYDVGFVDHDSLLSEGELLMFDYILFVVRCGK